MTQDQIIDELAAKLEDLGFDYDRMSMSGQQTYDEIMHLVSLLTQ